MHFSTLTSISVALLGLVSGTHTGSKPARNSVTLTSAPGLTSAQSTLLHKYSDDLKKKAACQAKCYKLYGKLPAAHPGKMDPGYSQKYIDCAGVEGVVPATQKDCVIDDEASRQALVDAKVDESIIFKTWADAVGWS